MAGNEPGQRTGEELKSQPYPAPSYAGHGGPESAPDQELELFGNENFSIARRGEPLQLVLAGEIDFPGIPQLTAALRDATDGSAVIHVDLADVSFCDLAALRTIIGLGRPFEDQEPRRVAQSVILHNVPRHIENVMRIVGWDTTPGLTIDSGARTP